MEESDGRPRGRHPLQAYVPPIPRAPARTPTCAGATRMPAGSHKRPPARPGTATACHNHACMHPSIHPSQKFTENNNPYTNLITRKLLNIALLTLGLNNVILHLEMPN